MKIAIPGGTGQIGTVLARALHQDGHEVIVIGRQSPKIAPWRVARWNPASAAGWEDKFDGVDVVINLAGRSVNCRYTPENRKEILQSRVESVLALGQAMSNAKRPPRVWLQASTATIYAHTYGAPNDEVSGVIGGTEPDVPDTWRFSIDVAKAWEKAFDEIPAPGTRKVKLRSAMTMSPDRGGIFDTLIALVRRGLGGKSGDGRQYVSWIHEADFIRAIYFLIERDDIDGAVNLVSPNPLPNREFMAGLRRAWGTNIGLPSAKWMLEIGAGSSNGNRARLEEPTRHPRSSASRGILVHVSGLARSSSRAERTVEGRASSRGAVIRTLDLDNVSREESRPSTSRPDMPHCARSMRLPQTGGRRGRAAYLPRLVAALPDGSRCK